MAIIVNDTTPRDQYTATSAQTAFTYSFEIFEVTDIKVYNGSSLLTYASSPANGTQYSVSNAGITGGGVVTLGSGGASNGNIITIIRDIPVKRTTDFPSSGPFNIESLNTDLDKIIAIMREREDEISRALQLSDTDSTATMTLPVLATRASKVLAFDSSGEPDTSVSSAGLSALGAITSDISTVSGISANVTTVAGIAANVTAVAGDATDIGAVAAKATEIGILGTTDAVADMAILGTSAIVTDMDLLGTSANVTAMGLLGNSATITDLGLLGTSAIVTDMDLLATSANVTAMGLLGNSATVTDLGILGTSAIVTDLDLLATSANVTAMGLLGTSANVSAMGLLGNSTTIADMAILATTDIVADLALLATTDFVADLNQLATTDFVADLTAIEAIKADVATVADNIAGVNSFADRYRVGSSDPSSSLDAGDLAFNTTSNALKYYTGSTWSSIGVNTDINVKVSANDSTAGYLNGKLVAGEGIDLTEGSDGSDETLTIIGEDASTSNKGVASFHSDNFSVSSGAVTIKAGGVDLTAEVTGTLPVNKGGTGAATHTANSVLIGAGTSAVTSVAPSTNGNVLTSNGTVWASTAPAGGGTSWQSVVTASTLTTVAGRGYPINTTSNACTVTLPASASVGDTIQIVDYAGTFSLNKITLTSSLKIEGGTDNLFLTNRREAVTIIYVDATQGWVGSSGVNEGNTGIDALPYNVEWLMIAGGAGGETSNSSGGGGAGGYRNAYASETSGGGGSTESVASFIPGILYTIDIGAGGAAETNGSDSSISGNAFTTLTATGGGTGGERSNTSSLYAGHNGGSGGGGGTTSSGNLVCPGGAGTSSQGFAGGSGQHIAGTSEGGGAGGGASAVGANNSGATGGTGGAGLASSITGSAVTRGGGGGGSGNNQGGGGSGGGGAAGNNSGTAGTANTGGGGGSGNASGGSGTGGAGGSGVIILRMLDANYSGTTSGSPTVATGQGGSSNETILTFNGDGSYTA